MKTRILSLFIGLGFLMMALIATTPLRAQFWNYDFGTATGSFISASGYSVDLLPQPPADGGNDRLSIGAVAQGSGFYLDNPGLSALGSGSELRSTASTGVAVNKFSIYGYQPTKYLHSGFSVLFGNAFGNSGPRSGFWYFYQGSGNIYSNSANASTALNESFISLRFEFVTGGKMKLAYHDGNNWIDLTPYISTLNQASVYRIDIYGNNSNAPADYYSNGSYSLAADKWDLWIDGVKMAGGLSSGGYGNNLNMDSWLFAGEQSTINYATIFIDDMKYSNELPQAPLPVSLLTFDGKSSEEGVILEWVTASETNNDFFTVEVSDDAKNFRTLSRIQGAGNSNFRLEYSFLDVEAIPGLNYYRLKQTDYDGSSVTSQVIAVSYGTINPDFTISALHVSGGNPVFVVNGLGGSYTAEIFNVSGALLFQQNLHLDGINQQVSLPVGLERGGIYILNINNGVKAETLRFFSE